MTVFTFHWIFHPRDLDDVAWLMSTMNSRFVFVCVFGVFSPCLFCVVSTSASDLSVKTRLWHDLLCVKHDVKLYSLTHSLTHSLTPAYHIAFIHWNKPCIKSSCYHRCIKSFLIMIDCILLSPVHTGDYSHRIWLQSPYSVIVTVFGDWLIKTCSDGQTLTEKNV